MELDYIHGYHTVHISKICPYFAVLRLTKYCCPCSLFLRFILICDLRAYFLQHNKFKYTQYLIDIQTISISS